MSDGDSVYTTMKDHTIAHGYEAYNANPDAYKRNTARLQNALAYVDNKARVRAVNTQLAYASKTRRARLKQAQANAPALVGTLTRARIALDGNARKREIEATRPLSSTACAQACKDIMQAWQS